MMKFKINYVNTYDVVDPINKSDSYFLSLLLYLK